MEKTSFKFDSFILTKIKGGEKTDMLPNAYDAQAEKIEIKRAEK